MTDVLTIPFTPEMKQELFTRFHNDSGIPLWFISVSIFLIACVVALMVYVFIRNFSEKKPVIEVCCLIFVLSVMSGVSGVYFLQTSIGGHSYTRQQINEVAKSYSERDYLHLSHVVNEKLKEERIKWNCVTIENRDHYLCGNHSIEQSPALTAERDGRIIEVDTSMSTKGYNTVYSIEERDVGEVPPPPKPMPENKQKDSASKSEESREKP